MGVEYLIFYSEASVICIIILLMILINDKLYSTQQETQVCFNRAVISIILYFISDACWASMLSGLFPKNRVLVVLFNLLNYVLLSMMAYEWFMFMAASEKLPFRKSKRMRFLCLLPMIVSTLIILIAYIADPFYWIDRDNNLNGAYYPLMIAAPAFYLLAAFAISMVNARRTELREEKKLYWMIAFFPLGVSAFGLLQVVSLNAPTFCFGCTIMLLFFYIQHMQTLISVDSLTKLNNRGQINRYMEQIRYKENTRVFIMMIDIDRFKQINDTFGHAEGDNALILVSEVLKQVCEHIKSSAFLARYGGDEFTIIIQNPEENEFPEQLADSIRSTLSETQKERQLPYHINVSIGYDELRDGKDTMKDCMIRADERLYKEKRKKAGIRRAIEV